MTDSNATELAEDSLVEKAAKLPLLTDDNKTRVITALKNLVLDKLKDPFVGKALAIIRNIPQNCHLTYISQQHRNMRSSHPDKFHPVSAVRGEIYNALIDENVGAELNSNHLVIIVSNNRSNIYAEKVIVVPIEGDGRNINTSCQIALKTSDLDDGKLDKDPSRIIMSDLLTLDKARLSRRIGKVKKEKMVDIDKMLKKQLNL
jgi:mRNA-degrading endonuclease toxin of MazEF toxin-antitoxin module